MRIGGPIASFGAPVLRPTAAARRARFGTQSATPRTAVALTVYGRLEDRIRVLEAGFQEYVPKPVDAAELRDVIVRLAAKGHER